MRRARFKLAWIFLFALLPGCISSKFVTREDFEIHQAAMNRQVQRLSADLSVTRGAIRENREAINVLEDQIQEVSKKLGMLDAYAKKTSELETKFNSKMSQMKQIVVAGEKRLIEEINKTRQQVVETASDSGYGSSESGVNVYEKSNTVDLNTGYYHVVEPGESISKIAARYQVPIDDIIRANGIAKPDALYVGQKLFIPDPDE